MFPACQSKARTCEDTGLTERGLSPAYTCLGGQGANRLSRWLIPCVFATLLGGDLGYAQTADLAGRVTDSQDVALVGVTATLSAPEASGSMPRVAITDQTGTYRFDAIDPGRYTLTVELLGFRTEHREAIDVVAGSTLAVDIQLSLAPFAQQVDVVAVAPLLGRGISRARIPATVFVIDGSDLASRQGPSVADALHKRLGAITLEGATTNPFQPTVRFRGFTASPLLGLPQGIAVYQNGVRINEPFGDTVQFDLIPQFALDGAQLSAGAEPTYGLNALGGALALRLKNGFSHSGFRGEVLGGSFDRFSGTAEYGASRGAWGFYVGATRFDEVGWRDASPSEVTQVVTDLGYREGRVDAGISFTFADSSLNGNGPAPVELLAADRSALFTFPDITDNRLAFTQARFNVAVSPTWSVQLSGYYRDLDRRTLNGDEAEFGVCDDDALPPGAPATTLCAPAGDAAGGAVMADPLVDARTGVFVTSDDAGGDGAFNRTTTRAKGYGAAFQATAHAVLGGRENVLTLGASADLADITFASSSEVGTLTPARGVTGSGLFAGVFGVAPDDRFSAGIDTDNRSLGVYLSNTLSMTERVHVTVSGRFNRARIDILDRLGTSLNGNHDFSRFNVGAGAVFELTDAASMFGRYTESNRAPTAAELSCADPAEPCRVPNAFVSDPPLEQAVARSFEGGVRGRVGAAGRASLDWSVTAYRTAIADDILFVASPARIGTGFFQNAGDTRHLGLDFDVTGQVGRVGWFASYGLVQATFESVLRLPSQPEVNDAVSEDGTLEVVPGDRRPGIPRHSLKAGVQYAVTDVWDIAFDAITASSRVFVGDEGNDQVQLEGFGVINLRSAYRISENLEAFVRVDNLLDKQYATFGVLAEIELFLREAPGADDPRFVGPGPPRSAFAGLRVGF